MRHARREIRNHEGEDNLQNVQLTEKHRQDIDDLIWNFVWLSWQEARRIHEHGINEKTD